MRLTVLSFLCSLRAEKRFSLSDSSPIFVLGAFSSASGLAQGARLYAEEKQQEGKPVVCVDVTGGMVQSAEVSVPDTVLSLDQLHETHCCGGTVVIHANPPQFHLVLCKLSKKFLANKRIVAYWAWELETLPDVWKLALEYVDAVEVPSTFVRDTLCKYTRKPVTVVPHPVPAPQHVKTSYARDGVIRCLFIFSMASTVARKNPLAALKAFALAFPAGSAELTFKVGDVQADPAAFHAFQEACAQGPGVRIVTQAMTPDELDALYLQHDIYLSLHRSEGYGLTLREAMLRGLHVVATGWSGNMDFMTGELAHPVPYTLVPVAETRGTFKGLNARWAEADVRAAAEILQTIQRNMLKREAA